MTIDHEYRIVTKTLIEALSDPMSKINEPVFFNKILIDSLIDCKISRQTSCLYLKSELDICGIYYRGLPLNSAKSYFSQELELEECFYNIQENLGRKIEGFHIAQIPNPDFVSFKEFEKFINNFKVISGFELNPSWHGKYITDKSYSKFLNYVSEIKLPLSLEVDHPFRISNNELVHFFKIAEKYSEIKYWLPHLGCGIFLYWNRLISTLKQEPTLLSSIPKSIEWLDIFNLNEFRHIPIVFASDHPFNDNKSKLLYAAWKRRKI